MLVVGAVVTGIHHAGDEVPRTLSRLELLKLFAEILLNGSEVGGGRLDREHHILQVAPFLILLEAVFVLIIPFFNLLVGNRHLVIRNGRVAVGNLYKQKVRSGLLLVKAHLGESLRQVCALCQQCEVLVVECLLFNVTLQVHIGLHNVGIVLGHVVKETLRQLAAVVSVCIREEAACIGVRIISGHQVAQLVRCDGDAERIHLGIERDRIHQLVVDVVPQLVFLLMGEGPAVLLADHVMVMIVFFIELKIGNFRFSHFDKVAVDLVAGFLQITNYKGEKCKCNNG